MKFKALLASTLLVGTLAACGTEEAAEEPKEETPAEQPAAEEPKEEAPAEDVVAAASITDDPAVFTAALGEEGTWIVAATADMTVDKEIVVAGEFHSKDDPTADIYRKLALYTQDEERNVTGTFTLTVPKMTVQSENFKIQNGTVKGNVYVEANGFTLTEDTTIDGDLIFANEDVKATAVIEGTVTGGEDAANADAVASASLVYSADAIVNGLSEKGTWIVATYGDIVVDEEVVVAGEFHSKDDPSADIYRKLGMYTQDKDRNVLDTFSLTVPKMTVQSPNFKIQNGTVIGDVVVEADGFTLTEGTTIEGNLTFASKAAQDSAVIEGKVTGKTEVK